MSKLSTLLRRASRSEPAPLGFASMATRIRNLEMLITVVVEDLEVETASAAADAGADSILLDTGDLRDDAEKIRAITGAINVPCGLRLNEPPLDAGTAAHALGLDFLRIEDDDTPAAALLDEETGFVLAVDRDAPDTYLRTLDTMPFDALYVGEIDMPFTIRRQLDLRRISGFSRKPLLVRTGDVLTAEDLECLRDAGVASVVVDGDADVAEQLDGFKRRIKAMRPHRRRRNDRQDNVAFLPSPSRGSESEEEEE